MNTHHADSYLAARLPADGTYCIHLTDAQGQGGPDFAYRLRISEPRPDFALRVIPSSISLRTGMSAAVTVYALRHDGFTNAIHMELKDAPPGFSISGATLAAGQDKAQFTLKASGQATGAPVALSIEGRALIGGQWVMRRAVPAEDMMQAFFYRHLVPSAQLAVVVSGPDRPFLRDAFKILAATPVKIPLGSSTHVRISAPPKFYERFTLELNNAPEGILLTSVSPVPEGLDLVFACDPIKAKAGATGNLICDVMPRKPVAESNQKKPGAPSRRGIEAALPAIPFEVPAE